MKIISNRNNIEFKVLMHCGIYVDANRLDNGIYTCNKPFIYDKNETIESLIDRAKMMKDMSGSSFISDKYLGSLAKCELVNVVLIIEP